MMDPQDVIDIVRRNAKVRHPIGLTESSKGFEPGIVWMAVVIAREFPEHQVIVTVREAAKAQQVADDQFTGCFPSNIEIRAVQ